MDARYWECKKCRERNDIFHPKPKQFVATMKAILSGDSILVDCCHCDHTQIIKIEGKLIAVSA